MPAFRKRLALAVAVLAVAAPAAWAASGGGSHPVHATIDRTGSVNVSGYDGGVSLTNVRP